MVVVGVDGFALVGQCDLGRDVGAENESVQLESGFVQPYFIDTLPEFSARRATANFDVPIHRERLPEQIDRRAVSADREVWERVSQCLPVGACGGLDAVPVSGLREDGSIGVLHEVNLQHCCIRSTENLASEHTLLACSEHRTSIL